MLDVVLRPEDAEQRDVVVLLDASYRELAPLYGMSPNGRFEPLHLPAGRSVFLVARCRGEAIGCAAVVPLAEDTGEVKRVYVRPAWRGQGVATQMLRELERRAVEMGYRRLRLETGDRQPDAIHLYENLGYRHVPCWTGDPNDVCMEKTLDV